METKKESEEYTTIQLTKNTYDLLAKRKIHPRQSFNEIIIELMEEVKKPHI